MKYTKSILYRRILFPVGVLYILSTLIVLLHAFAHVQAYSMPHPLFLLSVSILLLTQVGIIHIFWKNRVAITCLDQLLADVCAQAPPSYQADSDTFWNDFDNLFNSYLSNVNRNYASELLVQQVEFSTLQSQINPHFLYNTLDSLRGHALTTGATDIADMAEALSHFFRYSISRTGDFVTVQQELDSIKNYFHIQRYRFGDGLVLSLNLSEEDDLTRYYMPKLTLQPLVENCMAHGFSDSPTLGTITMQVIVSRTRLTITVEDSGVGMDAATLSALREKINTVIPPQAPSTPTQGGKRKHGGLALNNVNQRIKLFFGQEYGLSISSTPHMGTTVVLELPLKDQIPTIS